MTKRKFGITLVCTYTFDKQVSLSEIADMDSFGLDVRRFFSAIGTNS
jgi:hypothetical protein